MYLLAILGIALGVYAIISSIRALNKIKKMEDKIR